jgi:hypothetical protein
MSRVSEHPAGSREWWRDWSEFWMEEARAASAMQKQMLALGWMDLSEIWRRIAIDHLRNAFEGHKRSWSAHDASEWRS